MAFSSTYDFKNIAPVLGKSLQDLLWGKSVKHDVFKRWTQGFIFSDDEPTALVQEEGGPCAVIAPVQAFLLKRLLFSSRRDPAWREITGIERGKKLCEAFAEILIQAACDEKPIVVVKHMSDVDSKQETAQPSSSGDDVQAPNTSAPPDLLNGVATEDSTSAKRQCHSHEDFHFNLQITYCNNRGNLYNMVEDLQLCFQRHYGILAFLCSVILTRGLESVKNELEDPQDTLIDGIYGHGSQSLINLLLTGRAAPNVWDGDQEVSGLKLHGIEKQSTVGFLTLLEHLRYLEVGWYLKNPVVPIWLVGSETHLTVLFSLDERLVDKGTPQSRAHQLFKQFDTESRGFISATDLEKLLESLELVSDPEYVKIMQEKLDPEDLGIITLNGFLEEFFPTEKTGSNQTGEEDGMKFTLYHYNGLPRSNQNNKVVFQEGQAFLPNMPDVQIITDSSAIRTCLMTKWSSIEVDWKASSAPSVI